MIRRISVALIALCMVFMSSVSASAAPRDDILTMVNAARAENGLAPVKDNVNLRAVAQNWSQTMADSGTLSHNPQAGNQIPPGWKMWGENVGYSVGSPDNTKVIFDGWMNSPGHRANILKPEFTDMGVGVVIAPDGTMWATQNFAQYPAATTPTPGGSAAPPATAAPPAASNPGQGQPASDKPKEDKGKEDKGKKDEPVEVAQPAAPAPEPVPVQAPAPTTASTPTPAAVAAETETSPSPTPSTTTMPMKPKASAEATTTAASATQDRNESGVNPWLIAGLALVALACGVGAVVVYRQDKKALNR